MNVRFIRCTSDLLESVPIIDGQLLITSDTAYLYADINTQRIQIVCNNSGEGGGDNPGGGDTPVDPSAPNETIAIMVPSYAAELKVINAATSDTIDFANASTIIDTFNGKSSNLYLPREGTISSYEGENIYINLDNISSPEKVFYYTFANSSGDYGDYKTLIYPSYATTSSAIVKTETIKIMWLDSSQNIVALDTVSVENSVVDYISFKKPSTSTHLRIVRITNNISEVILDTSINMVEGRLLCPLYTGLGIVWESYSNGQLLSIYDNQYLVFYLDNSTISGGNSGTGEGGDNTGGNGDDTGGGTIGGGSTTEGGGTGTGEGGDDTGEGGDDTGEGGNTGGGGGGNGNNDQEPEIEWQPKDSPVDVNKAESGKTATSTDYNVTAFPYVIPEGQSLDNVDYSGISHPSVICSDKGYYYPGFSKEGLMDLSSTGASPDLGTFYYVYREEAYMKSEDLAFDGITYQLSEYKCARGADLQTATYPHNPGMNIAVYRIYGYYKDATTANAIVKLLNDRAIEVNS